MDKLNTANQVQEVRHNIILLTAPSNQIKTENDKTASIFNDSETASIQTIA